MGFVFLAWNVFNGAVEVFGYTQTLVIYAACFVLIAILMEVADDERQ